MKKFVILNVILLLTACLGVVYLAYAYNLPKLFLFKEKDALNEWQEKVFKNKVLYSVEPMPDGGNLVAQSNNACSGLIYRISFNIKNTPMISWQWKVVKFPDKLNQASSNKGGWVEKDDYAARVYVIFPALLFSGTKSIEYVWDETLPVGTILTSPYFKNIKLIVIESGKSNLGQWAHEKRNIYEDYKKAFGKEPFYKVGAIAIMTDTDNTLSTAETLYKDIKVGYKDE